MVVDAYLKLTDQVLKYLMVLYVPVSLERVLCQNADLNSFIQLARSTLVCMLT